MKIIKALEIPESPNPHGVSVCKLYDSEHVAAVLITLKPGESLKLHKTPVDALFFCLEGRGTVEIGGQAEVVEPFTLVPSPAGVPHRLFNAGEATARFLVVKTPRPAAETKIL